MLEKNSFPLGILIGLILPLLTYGILFGIFELLEAQGWVSSAGFRPMFRERTIGLIALGMNALALNFYHKRHCPQTIRGLVIMITAGVLGWLVLFGKYVI
jgi:uncharacterized membrane protein YraQ (UPF0718 family)